ARHVCDLPDVFAVSAHLQDSLGDQSRMRRGSQKGVVPVFQDFARWPLRDRKDWHTRRHRQRHWQRRDWVMRDKLHEIDGGQKFLESHRSAEASLGYGQIPFELQLLPKS